MEIAFGILQSSLSVLDNIWWIFLPIIFFYPLRDIWVIYVKDRYIKSLAWVLLEVRVPKEVYKTPKAMEQIFAAVYARYSHGLNFLLHYIDGLVDDWVSFEIVGTHAGIYFYVYLPVKMRNAIESAIYAQYPDAEIQEVPDYTELLPRTLPNETYDLWGTDLVLGRETPYPIRTYPYFEDAQDERRLDPISALTEVMASLREGEMIWWQVVVSATGDDPYIENKWQKEGEEIIAKIQGKKEEKPIGIGDTIYEWAENLFAAPVRPPVWSAGSRAEEKAEFKFLNPAEEEIVRAVANKIAKLGFETNIRFMYLARRDVYDSSRPGSIMGTMRQFNTQNLNRFRPDGSTITLISGWKPRLIPKYGEWMVLSRKRKLFDSYISRRLNSRYVGKYRPTSRKFSTFNTEELATLYHFPTVMVGTPKIKRLEVKKGEPPAGLPVKEI